MKIIEGLKKIKDLSRKADDYVELLRENCALTNWDTPKFGEEGAPMDVRISAQRAKVNEWLQGHADLLKEILRLRIAIQRTNLAVKVKIEIDGVTVEKSIAEWIHRRRDLASKEQMAWHVLSDRGFKEGKTNMPGGEERDVKIVRFYSPEQRLDMLSKLSSEPSTIDAKMEIVNATTDLIEE